MSAAISGGDPRATTPVSDLSETGVFVHTDEPLAIGSSIELAFTVYPEPDQPVLFKAEGRVVRHSSDEKVPGMGVDFVELDDGARDVMRMLMLRDEANRQTNRQNREFITTDETLRTHGLVARLLQGQDGS